MTSAERHQVSGVEVEASTNRLHRGDLSVSIEPRAMQVLALLLERQGQVVSRADIFDRVWGAAEVSDDALNRTVFDLRQAFKTLNPKIQPIETIRKVGYRLLVVNAEPEPAQPVKQKSQPNWLIPGAAAVAVAAVLLKSWPEVRPAREQAPEITIFSNQYGFDTHPTFHPDGQRVIFTCTTDSKSQLGLCQQSMDQTTPSLLLTDAGEGAAVHPDGQRIAYQKARAALCEIRVFDISTRSDTLLTPCRRRSDGSLAWSADGDWLYFSDSLNSPSGPYHILSVPTGGGPLSTVTRPPVNSLGDLYPAPSPDGSALAFFRADRDSTISTYVTPGIGRVYLAPLADGARDESQPVQALTDTPAEITGLDWYGLKNEADLVFFSSARDNRFVLRRIAPSGGATETYGGFAGIVRQPSVSPTGIVIAESWSADADIFEHSMDNPASAPRPVFSSSRYDFSPAVSPDQTQLAWVSTRNGRPQVWIGDLGTSAVLDSIELDGGAEAESPQWSPDSRNIAFEARRDGQSQLFLYSLDTGITKFLSLPGDNRVPSWSLDGTSLFHASDRSGSWEAWRYELATGASEQVSSGGAYTQREYRSKAEHGLAFSRRNQAGLWKQSFLTRAAVQILDDLPLEYWGNWTVLNDEIFFALNTADGPQVQSINIDTGERLSRLHLDQSILRESTNLSVSPDGLTVYYAVRTRITADLIRFRLKK